MKKLKPKRPPYPLVECAHHKGDPLPGYAVCVHLAKKADGWQSEQTRVVGFVERATPSNMGAVLCTECAAHPDLPVGHIVTACAHFVADNFGVEL